MSRTFLDCSLCSLGFDADNESFLFCNMCACYVGPCCKEHYLDTLGEPGESGEMLEERCPFCNREAATDTSLLYFALKKLKLSRNDLLELYQAEVK